MNEFLIQTVIVFGAALIAAHTIIPQLMSLAPRLGLIDKPNARKVHQTPIPLIGGIAIAISTAMSILLSSIALHAITENAVLIGSVLFIFIIAVWDDRVDLSARLRLVAQLIAAGAVAASGVRIESLQGILGIYELPILVQYIATITIITGVTNAFNLMDGVDGLAGGLALVNSLVLFGLSWYSGEAGIALIFMALSGALIAFLKNNSYPARIFMGDGGSMMLGFLLASFGIKIIQSASANTFTPNTVLLIVSTLMLLPVLDALRVFALRHVLGFSVFTPDKSHMHHLILMLGLNHGKVASFIIGFEIFLVFLAVVLTMFFAHSTILIILMITTLIISKLLVFNKKMVDWQLAIQQREKGLNH